MALFDERLNRFGANAAALGQFLQGLDPLLGESRRPFAANDVSAERLVVVAECVPRGELRRHAQAALNRARRYLV